MPVDYCYIASNGFSIRMITQTDLLGKLRSSGKSVGLITVDKNDPVIAAYCEARGIELYEFDIKGKLSSENYMFKRKYFLEDIESNTALREKHYVVTKGSPSRNPIKRIWPYYYWMIYSLIPYFPSIRRRFIRNERKHLRSKEAQKLISDIQPRNLIATYPVNYNEAVLLHYGNITPGITTWIHLLSWDNISCKGRWPEIADQYIAWGSIMKEELIQYYQIDPKFIHMCGVPHFDLHIEAGSNPEYAIYLERMGLVPHTPYLFFAMSSPRFAPYEIEIVEKLAGDIENGQYGDLQLIIRPHPQNITGSLADQKWLPRLEKLNQLNKVKVDLPNLVNSKIGWNLEEQDMIRFAHLIGGSAIVINSGSTVSIDGMIQNKPVIMTSFDGYQEIYYWKSARRLIDYPHLKKLVNFGGVTVARSFTELASLINSFLMNPGWNQPKIQETIKNELFKNDGQATNRVLEVLQQN